jgi:spore maturation protein CgeB
MKGTIMKILFLDSPAFAKLDMLDAFHQSGITTDLFMHEDYRERNSASYEAAFDTAVEEKTYDFVFSFNYFPILAKCCQKHNLKYVSYVYDSPLVTLYSFTITCKTNYIFLFDRPIYEQLKNGGISTVYYLPLAANPSRLSTMTVPKEMLPQLQSEVSFVGSLYNEDHLLYDRLVENVSPFTNGYLSAIIAAQQQVYGSFFIEELLTGDILKDLMQSVPYDPNSDGIESPAYVYAHYFIARKMAELDRTRELDLLSQHHEVRLFTNNPTPQLPKVKNMGSADYYDMMPLIFPHSRINLNITLRSIQTGIPLRAFDIMGSGGFLLSNYQEDFYNIFVPGEDCVLFSSDDEMLSLVDYYLSHEKERSQIAANGLGKVKEQHTYVHRVKTMLEII